MVIISMVILKKLYRNSHKHVMIEKLLQFLIRKVYTELLESVELDTRKNKIK